MVHHSWTILSVSPCDWRVCREDNFGIATNRLCESWLRLGPAHIVSLTGGMVRVRCSEVLSVLSAHSSRQPFPSATTSRPV